MKIEVNEKALKKIAKTLDEQIKETAIEVVRDKTLEAQKKAKEIAAARVKSHPRGRLIEGIVYDIKAKKDGTITGTVRTTAATKAPKKPGKRNVDMSEKSYKNGALYGAYLEASKRYKGTGDASKYAHLRPAYNIIKPTVMDEVRKRVFKRLKK